MVLLVKRLLTAALAVVAVAGQFHNTTTQSSPTHIERNATSISSATPARSTYKGSPLDGGAKFVGAPQADASDATWRPTAVITIPATFTDATTMGTGFGFAVMEIATVARAFGGPNRWQESIGMCGFVVALLV